jgi:tetratricopeptide (TPR) repeat protein
MGRLIALYHEANIPVFIADLATNDKDLPPFLSGSSETRPDKEFTSLIQHAEKEMQEGNIHDVLKQLRLAEKTDSAYAGIQYLIGRAYFNLNQWDSARIHFVMARNYDQLRFRAPEAINSVIAWIAREHDACFIPVKSIFEKESPGGIIGNELITEHVHPNLTGYYLIAKAFHDSLVNSSVLKNRTYAPLDESIFRKEMPITEMDSLYGVYNIIMLKKGWPFYVRDSVVIKPQDPLQARLAKQIVLNETNWLKAMDKIYLDALSQHDHQTGMMISEGLYLEFPYDIRFVVKAARHATSIGYSDKAAWYFAKAFSLSSSPEYARESMIAYLKADMPEKALEYIKILMNNREGKDKYLNISSMTENIIRNKIMLSYDSSQLNSALEIAKNYYLMGNFKPAEKYSLVALKIDPGNYEANTLLKEINKQVTANVK